MSGWFLSPPVFQEENQELTAVLALDKAPPAKKHAKIIQIQDYRQTLCFLETSEVGSEQADLLIKYDHELVILE